MLVRWAQAMVVFGMRYSSEDSSSTSYLLPNPVRKPDAEDCLVSESSRLGRILLNSSWRSKHLIWQHGVIQINESSGGGAGVSQRALPGGAAGTCSRHDAAARRY